MLGHLAKQLACVNWTLRALTAPQHSAHEISLKLIEIKPFFPPLSPPLQSIYCGHWIISTSCCALIAAC